jgi:hypothetical protein
VARVLQFEGGNIAPAQSTSARFQAQDFGPGIGRGVEQLGAAIGDTADTINGISALHDEAAVKEAVNGHDSYYTQVAYTGPNALFAKQGRDAIELGPNVQKALQEDAKERRAQLQNPRQQYLFDQAVSPQMNQRLAAISEHTAKETLSYNADESTARADTQGQLAGFTYVQNPQEGEQHIATGLAEVENVLKLKGAGPEEIATKKLAYASGIYKDIGTDLAYSGPDGPKLALALVEKHGDLMTGDDRFAVSTHARAAQDKMDADQRQAEAEQRRIVTQARTDARLRAESVAGNLDYGSPLDPKTYASAITDAQTAEDPGLLKRLQVGQLKNTVLYAHQSDTPIVLQNKINDLNASIVKQGTNVDPGTVVTRDALTQLYDHASEQLKSNGIAYAAQHLGLVAQPLNLMDPNSIAARADLAGRASQLTGTQVAPLQPAEVQPLTQQWRAGDVNSKVGLVLNLAKFGPLAPAAAQQIAPNDAGLVHLIGLASHSNRGVAISRVNQALAGYEAMKTEGQIVGKIASQPDFNTFTGSALQFMPGARDGVFTVAKALLAEDASQHGWSDNNAADDKAWYRAVNSALGAYNRGEVQYGGLAGFNGAQTVLPENMSLDDFETRISRANGPQLRAASNGLPVTGNGTQLDAGDLKKMHFIPVDDGVYRLESGGAFVHTKDGHPFEVDVRKLR